MSLQERTLVVRNFDPDKTTTKLLRELCSQAGPVKKVVMRSDHAFVEYEDVESVGYSKALLDGVKMFDQVLIFEPKLRLHIYAKYTRALNDYIKYDKEQRYENNRQKMYLQQQQQQMQFYPQYVAPIPIQSPMLQQTPSLQMPVSYQFPFSNQGVYHPAIFAHQPPQGGAQQQLQPEYQPRTHYPQNRSQSQRRRR